MGFVDRVDSVDGFHFNYHTALYEKVNSISNFQFLTFIDDRQRKFGQDFKASASEFLSQARLIRTLEETRAEDGMYLDGGRNDCAGNLISAI